MAAADRPARPLRILFSMRNLWYVKLFESVIVELASRGHDVHLLAERGALKEVSQEWNEAAEALVKRHERVTFAWAPRRIEDDWIDLRVMLRYGLDHLRFLGSAYAGAPELGARARRRTPQGIVSLADRPLFRTRAGRRLIAAVLRAAERATPGDADLAGCVAAHQADVILVTPLLTLGSEQTDVVRTARRLGVPTALCVGSWDHLSSKALIRELPDRVFVWNDTQKREAVELHGVPAGRVVVTGAQCFDQWFDRAPARDRTAFCARVGLDPARPYVLYVCSALFEGSPSEAAFARAWAVAIRASADPVLRDAGILVRPHPKRAFEWKDVDLSALPGVALWPPSAAAPFDAETKADYFDSLYHSAVTVGLNTSALIEAGIAGREVHTILLPEFHGSQEGTLHFRYLLEGGLLRSTRDLASHFDALGASLRAANPLVHHNRTFVERFVRPRGLSVAATPVFADAVEQLAASAVVASLPPMWVPALRRLLQPLALRTAGTFAQRAARDRRRVEKRRAREESIALLRAQRDADKARVQEARTRRYEEKARARAAREAAARVEKLVEKQRAR